MIAVGTRVLVDQPDGTTRPGEVVATSPMPGMWIVAVDQENGDRALTLHHQSKITEETS